jgi:hypothetical protein
MLPFVDANERSGDIEGCQCTIFLPCWHRRGLVGCAVGLRKHKPVVGAIDEPPIQRLLVLSRCGLLDEWGRAFPALSDDGHAERERLFSLPHLATQRVPAHERVERPDL